MKWIYSIKNKMTVAALLFTVMCLVLLSNFSTRNESAKINSAVSSIYKDRLLVESYIFRYSQNLQNIVEISDNNTFTNQQKQQPLAPILSEIKELNDAYNKTELTQNEAQNFNKLVQICHNIDEQTHLGEFVKVKQSAKEAMNTLQILSAIQVSEAKAQMSNIDKFFGATLIYSQFEMAVLIIIGLIILALILASKSLKVNNLPQSHNLN